MPDEGWHSVVEDSDTSPMQDTHAYLRSLGLPPRDRENQTGSPHRFDDGAHYRVEIPSVEGPEAFETVLAAAAEYDVPVHRISQGSGIMMQTDAEVEQMITLGREHGVEVSLFTGPRGAWDIGEQAATASGRVAAPALRGADQLTFAIEDVRHGCELGLRSVLVADVGHLWVLGQMKRSGQLPEDLVLKVSIQLPIANPATARLLEDLGASTLNLPVDLSVTQIAAIREAVGIPLDLYIEGADDFGAPVRYYEIPEIVRVAAPVHLKFTVRNAPGLYPAGGHIRDLVLSSARERVRRAAIGLGMLRRYYPEAKCS